MKYTKNIMRAALAAALCAVATSCSDWLDVKQTDRVLEEQVYASELKITEALNGIYMTMASTSVYGKNLTFYTTELLANRYCNTTSINTLDSYKERPELCAFDYTQSVTRTHLNTIYSKGYNVILNINLFIDRLEATQGVVSESRKALMLGEAYALRAFMHFDLLRLYGPSPLANREGAAIPYYTKADVEWQDIETYPVIIGKIMADIETAIDLLENDPILTVGMVTGEDSDVYATDFFYTDYRNRRMNRYAVEALKARILMYDGKPESVQEAGLIAKNLILDEHFNASFPWTTSQEIYASRKADRIFSNEVLFGIHVAQMYTQWDSWFSAGKSSYTEILGVVQSNYDYMYYGTGGATTDVRAEFWMDFPRASDYKLTTKFQKSEDETDRWYFQPLIRKTELYLIAAEVYGDLSFLNEIRTHRNLLPLESTADLATDICKEYMKEFIGEGQLWFYYKRLNMSNIRSHNPSATITSVSVSPSQYIIPKPSKELEGLNKSND